VFSGGVLYGLGAALGWGLSDFMVALVARRVGSFTTLVWAQAASFVALSILLSTGATHLPSWHVGLLVLPALGLLAAVSYAAFYRALQLGPIALATPIVSGYAAVVIALSLTLGGETIPGLALAGAAITILGVTVAATDPRVIRDERRMLRKGSGPFFAGLAMMGFGVGAFLVGRYAKSTGWFGAVYLTRAGGIVVLATATVAVAARHRRRPHARPARRPLSGADLVVLCLIGVLDIGGYASFARGSELGFIAITAAASVIYPLIPVVFGVVHFGERPVPSQWAGVATVGVGLTLLALGR
jgi:drug/metabolite transporter (DMT)-like permease